MAIILDGKKLSNEIIEQLKQRIKQEKLLPSLAIVLCGESPASIMYTGMKKKVCAEIGITAEIFHFSEPVAEEEVIQKIISLNRQVDGIIVQLPLPVNLSRDKILSFIDPAKDVDGLTEVSLGGVLRYNEQLAPATPKGIIRLLEAYHISIKSKEVVIVNHSDIVGKPLAMMFANRGATVTVCHEFTERLSDHTKRADILVSGVGKPYFITKEMVKPQSVVVDVGINKIGNSTCGDVDGAVSSVAAFLTPVPGGVGPMTIAMLLENVVNRASKNL